MEPCKPAVRHLRRYTNLPSAIDVLLHKRLTLLDPSRWDDKNDASFLAEYKKQVAAKALLALCFTKSSETYHHWRTYSYGPDGVCFEFDDEALLDGIDRQNEGIIVGDAIYLEIGQLEKSLPSRDQLPFVKRYPYLGENEVRMIHVNKKKAVTAKHLPITLEAIRRVKLSPWMHKDLAKTVASALRTVAGAPQLEIYQSKLIDYPRWKNAITRNDKHQVSDRRL